MNPAIRCLYRKLDSECHEDIEVVAERRARPSKSGAFHDPSPVVLMGLSGAHEDVEHPGTPLILVIEGRQVLRRTEFDPGHVNAGVHGGFRHRR